MRLCSILGLLLALAALLCTARGQGHEQDLDIVEEDVVGAALLDSEMQPRELPPSTPTVPTTLTFCNTNYREPSVLAMLQKLMPEHGINIELPPALKEACATAAGLASDAAATSASIPNAMIKAANNWTEASIGAFMNSRLPFQALISDGLFELDRDVLDHQLVVESSVSARFYCSTEWSRNLPFRDSFCGCADGSLPSIQSDGERQGSMWCRISHTPNRPIRVDPFRRACITYRTTAKSDTAVVVSYKLDVPVLRDSLLWSASQSTVTYLNSLLKGTGSSFRLDYWKARYPSLTHWVSRALDLLGNHVPSYLASFIAGCFLLFTAESLAESIFFQYTLAALGGGLLGLVWVAFVIWRATESLLGNTIPVYQRFIAPLIHTFYGASMYYLFFNSFYLQRMMLEGVIKFWEHGIFGQPLAGKAFFAFSVVLSVFVTSYFGLFRPKSMSGYVLMSCIKVLGAILLFNGTSNGEISLFILMPVALLREELVWYYQRLQIEIVARTSTAYVRKVSVKSFEKTKKDTTERELKKLQQFLKENPKDTDTYHDTFFAGGRKEQAKNLYRFAHGDLHVGMKGSPTTGSVPRLSGFSFGSGLAAGGRRSGGDADIYDDDDDDEDDDTNNTYRVNDDGSAGGATPNRLRADILGKSPASQRRILKTKTSLLFRLAFPVVLLFVLTGCIAFLAVRFQHKADLNWLMRTSITWS